ncbi:nitroreductase/quinone reductase family protein [Cryptosporangium sp. NPDC048952]|uniref:nitroreductase/quinone reductase family protein n=1 Tax=Cryptosporangium sp. NPDC048952 TaxID=3363961 RepID=UPI00371E2B39
MADGPAWYAPKRWMYRRGRPGRLARVMNNFSIWLYAHDWLTFGRAAVLEVRGRRTGKTISLPVVVADYHDARYLVSMLGDGANWVRNVRAADGEAMLIQHGNRTVRLVELPADQRAPILRRYLELAPGARPHVPVTRTAPLSEFQQVADRYPVFRIDDPKRRA